MDGLKKNAPFLSKGKQTQSWNKHDLVFPKGDLNKVIESIEDLGWSEGSRQEGMHKNGRVWFRNGKWPIVLDVFSSEIYLRAPTSDAAINMYEDKGFEVFVTKMARKVLPTGAEYIAGTVTFTKSSMGADAQTNLESKIIDRAKTAGFKRKDQDYHGTPDGSTMGHGTNYVHPDGWTLDIISSFGSTKYNNYFSATLKYTKERD